jgi:predicted RNase H-like HicB family nuclease
MKRYLVVIEKTETGYSAYSPDLEGCIATGKSRKEIEVNMREAIRFHLDGMIEEGYTIPEPHTESSYIEIAV